MAMNITNIRGIENKRINNPKNNSKTVTVSKEATKNTEKLEKGIPNEENHSTVESKFDHFKSAGV